MSPEAALLYIRVIIVMIMVKAFDGYDHDGDDDCNGRRRRIWQEKKKQDIPIRLN